MSARLSVLYRRSGRSPQVDPRVPAGAHQGTQDRVLSTSPDDITAEAADMRRWREQMLLQSAA